MATRGSQMRNERHHGRFFLICITTFVLLGTAHIRLVKADSPTPPTVGDVTTPVSEVCKKLVCQDQPTCPEKDSNFNLCAKKLYKNTEQCPEKYRLITNTLYQGYTRIQQQYCEDAELSKIIDELFKSGCWSNASYCLAKNIGIDSGVQIKDDQCIKAGNNLMKCLQGEQFQNCSKSFRDAAMILYNSTQCRIPLAAVIQDDVPTLPTKDGENSADGPVTLTHITWLLWVTFLALVIGE